MIDKGIDPSLVIFMANNNALFPSPTLEATGSPIDTEITKANILIIKIIKYTETVIPFYIYPSPSIPIRVGKLLNEVVKAIYNNNIKANIIYQTYVNKYNISLISSP